MRADDDQWIEPEPPRSAARPAAPDANPPLTSLPGWLIGLWVLTALSCVTGPLVVGVMTLLGGALGLGVGAVAIFGPLGLLGASALLTLLAWQQIRENR